MAALKGCRAGKTPPDEALATRLAAREQARRELHARKAADLRREHANR